MLRVVSSLIAVPILLGIILKGTPVHFLILVTVASLVASYEYHKIVGAGSFSSFSIFAILVSPLIPVIIFVYTPLTLLTITAIGVMMLLTIKVIKGLSSTLDTKRRNVAKSLLGIVYTGGLLSYFVLLRNQVNGEGAVLFVLITIWMSDTIAYCIGKNFGTRKLAPFISPGKTIEGAVGGVIGSGIGALIAWFIFYTSITFATALFAGLLVGIAGQIGDLAESLIKREYGVKDSGVIIPGHGGLMDRLDSLCFAAPVFYFLQIAMQIA